MRRAATRAGLAPALAVMVVMSACGGDLDVSRNAAPFIVYLSIPADSTTDPALAFQVIMAGADLESQNAAAAHTTVTRLGATYPTPPRNNTVAVRSVAEGVGPRTKHPKPVSYTHLTLPTKRIV